jgi:hypothetical protein
VFVDRVDDGFQSVRSTPWSAHLELEKPGAGAISYERLTV